MKQYNGVQHDSLMNGHRMACVGYFYVACSSLQVKLSTELRASTTKTAVGNCIFGSKNKDEDVSNGRNVANRRNDRCLLDK